MRTIVQVCYQGLNYLLCTYMDSPTERIITLRITSERITSERINTERITS